MKERPLREGSKVAFQGNVWVIYTINEITFTLGRSHRGAQLVIEAPKAEVTKVFRDK